MGEREKLNWTSIRFIVQNRTRKRRKTTIAVPFHGTENTYWLTWEVSHRERERGRERGGEREERERGERERERLRIERFVD